MMVIVIVVGGVAWFWARCAKLNMRAARAEASKYCQCREEDGPDYCYGVKLTSKPWGSGRKDNR